MKKALSNPWPQLAAQPDFVLPEDKPIIASFNKRYAAEDQRIRLNLLPIPFLGRRDAPIVLLNLNPGYDPADNTRQDTPYFREAVRRCYKHEPTARPFFFFDDQIEGEPAGTGPGYRWWQRRVKGLKALDPRFNDALLAQAFLCVEYFPYRSQTYRPLPQKHVLDSQHYGFELVRQAMERQALIILMRSQKKWYEAVEGLENYPRLLTVRSFLNPVLHSFMEAEGKEMVVTELRQLLSQ